MFKRGIFFLSIIAVFCLVSESVAHYHRRCYEIAKSETYFTKDGSYIRIYYRYNDKLLDRRFRVSGVTITTDYAEKNVCAVFDPNSIYFTIIVVPTLKDQKLWEEALDLAVENYLAHIGKSGMPRSTIPNFIGQEE